MKKFFIIIPLLVVHPFLNAQVIESWDKTEEDKKEIRKFKHNFFHGFGITPGTAVDYIENVTREFNSDSTSYDYDLYSNFRYTLLSIEYDFRYNILNHKDNFSISLNCSPFYTFHITTRDFINKRSAGIPLGIFFNFKNHSTFNNIDDRGSSLGGGLIFNFLSRESENSFGNTTLPYVDLEPNREFYIRYTAKFRTYRLTINRSKTYKNRYGYIAFQYSQIMNKEFGTPYNRNAHDKGFKIVFGKILSY